ncbi:unnamed protein product [Meloidogyne enterolobii]|uniref:Uncharacterized protein n=1 Tax=Meloidogyne enterolobii TaxID=390850 RepID=A0ACB0ZK59_MELEN
MTGQCGNLIGSKMSEYQHYQDAPADKERVVVYTPKKWKQTRLNSSDAEFEYNLVNASWRSSRR